jgi:hypothetical protein
MALHFRNVKKMTYEMAMKILDKVREGIPYPESIITKALEMTGDLDGYGTFYGL